MHSDHLQYLAEAGAMSAELHRLFVCQPAEFALSRPGRERVNRLPLFWAQLYSPRRHVFFEVRQR